MLSKTGKLKKEVQRTTNYTCLPKKQNHLYLRKGLVAVKNN
jgi:hypothetical protein